MRDASGFALAPMAGAVRVLTWLMIPLPIFIVVVGVVAGSPRGAVPVAVFVALVWVFIWVWYRPTELVVAPDGLEIRWPMRRRKIPAGDLEGAERISGEDLKRDRGLLLRVGAGGIWGGFGMLWSSRGRHLDFYVSRTDGFVLVQRRTRRPLLVTPERPDEFVTAVQQLVGAS